MTQNDPNAKPAEKTQLEMVTSKGTIIIEVDNKNAPITAANFVKYANEKFFDGTIFHRVIPDFMIQGGGFTKDMQQKSTHAPIKNEASNGLKNDRGTLAMARTNDPDSATGQFFINLKNNDFLNYQGKSNPGYAVFGKVIKGMEVVDAIAKVKTGNKGPHGDVPVEPVIITSVKVIEAKS
ncbi:MAG: hypothetical protein A2Y07_11780 [Planctomycetes bacterium GWF2_50_10]|nr:MAG: hypothetical protein A2Y07_11780 [Planctomycetes bacterium GWF2_50_10]